MANILTPVNGNLQEVTIVESGLTPVNGTLASQLGVSEDEYSKASPIGYMRFYTGSDLLDLPIYNLNDVKENKLRIYTGAVIGCLGLVDTADRYASHIHIQTNVGVMSIRKR
jgi:hypothetical protein